MFKKALEALPGMPGSLPPPVKEAWTAAQVGRPGDRAAIINAVVARDCCYKDCFKADGFDITQFKKVFQKAESSHAAEGIGRTEMEAMWGHGDHERGAQLVELALARGELVEKNKLLYKRSHRITVTEGREHSFEASGTASRDDFGAWAG